MPASSLTPIVTPVPDAFLAAGTSMQIPVNFQLGLGLPWALTDSGYIDENDTLALESVLGQAAALSKNRNIVAVLALSSKWLSDRSDELRRAIEKHAVPVALALGHAADPLGAKRNVAGLLHVLHSPASVGLIRSDLSAVGALACGASIGAIGTGSGLRHVYPVTKGGASAPIYPSALVPASMGLVRLDKLAEAIALSPSELHWQCVCDVCQSRRMDYLLTDEEVYWHNLAAASEVARQVLSGDQGASRASWIAHCRAAQFVNLDIEASTSMNWPGPAYLGAWISATFVSEVGAPVPRT